VNVNGPCNTERRELSRGVCFFSSFRGMARTGCPSRQASLSWQPFSELSLNSSRRPLSSSCPCFESYYPWPSSQSFLQSYASTMACCSWPRCGERSSVHPQHPSSSHAILIRQIKKVQIGFGSHRCHCLIWGRWSFRGASHRPDHRRGDSFKRAVRYSQRWQRIEHVSQGPK
jgi:hypothetical protein